MKKNKLFILSLFVCVSMYSQQISTSEWQQDLEALKNYLFEKEYLFHKFSKNQFSTEIEELKSSISTTKVDEIPWKIQKILSHFKQLDLHLENQKLIPFPLEIKAFQNQYYVTKINKENSYLLGYKLVKINGLNMEEIIDKMKSVYYLPHKNVIEKVVENQLNNQLLLTYLQISNKDTITYTFKSKDKLFETIDLPIPKNSEEVVFAIIKPKNNLFNQRKNWLWFWKYGINFGQQVFLKYRVCSSKEHINKMMDSLNISENKYAKLYDLPLQEVYDAKALQPFLEIVAEKFKKKRYKKLIIDLRDNTKGSFLSSKKLIQRVKRIKRMNKKSKLLILINKNINAAAIKTVIEFQTKTKATIIGETVFGTQEDSNTNTFFILPNSQLKLNCPVILKKEIVITPDVKVTPTFSQYQNGIDGLLQTALDY